MRRLAWSFKEVWRGYVTMMSPATTRFEPLSKILHKANKNLTNTSHNTGNKDTFHPYLLRASSQHNDVVEKKQKTVKLANKRRLSGHNMKSLLQKCSTVHEEWQPIPILSYRQRIPQAKNQCGCTAQASNNDKPKETPAEIWGEGGYTRGVGRYHDEDKSLRFMSIGSRPTCATRDALVIPSGSLHYWWLFESSPIYQSSRQPDPVSKLEPRLVFLAAYTESLGTC